MLFVFRVLFAVLPVLAQPIPQKGDWPAYGRAQRTEKWRVQALLADLCNRLLLRIHSALERETPDLVLAQGDTTSVVTSAMASFPLGFRLATSRRAFAHIASMHPFPRKPIAW